MNKLQIQIKKPYKIAIIFICIGFLNQNIKANELKNNITINLIDNTLIEAFDIISDNSEYLFAFSNDIIPKKIKFTKEFKNANIKDILKFLLRGTGITFRIVDEQIILIKKKDLKKYTISGFIRDKETGDALIQANVYEKDFFQGTVSNQHGFYSLSLPEGVYTLIYSYIGGSKEITIKLSENIEKSILLEQDVELEEVIIIGNKNKQIINKTDPLGKINASTEKIESIPVIMGEPDLMKSIQLIPGIQGGSEANGAIYVRGGEPLQNLFLLDDVPIYNCFHLLGLFSVLNSDVIGNTQVFKAGFPAEYGGRLSSVVDVKTKEGNMKELKGNVSLGLVSSKLFLEGPLIKDKTSFALAGRLGYYYIYELLLPKEIGNENNVSNYNFSDINAKLTHRLSKNHKLYISFYNGNDAGENIEKEDPSWQPNIYTYAKDTYEQNWNNILGSIGWAGKISNKIFGNVSFATSQYTYLSYIEDTSYYSSPEDTSFKFIGTNLNNNVINYFGSTDIQYEISPIINLRVGYKYSLLNLNSENTRTSNFSSNYNLKNIKDTILAEYNYETNEQSGFLEIQLTPWKTFSINTGIHISHFQNDNYTNTIIQPRLTSNWEFIENIILKGSYAKMGQNIHMLGATRISLASDLFVAAGEKAPSEESEQYSLGLSYLRFKKVNIHIDAYYKTLDNLISFSEGESYFTGAPLWEDKIEIGTGKAKGIELLIEKPTGKLTGWLGYTYSNTTRKFPEINQGMSFPFIYDHRHYLNIVGKYEFNKKFDVGFNWLYHTGSTSTIPADMYYAHSRYIDGRMANWDGSIIVYFNEKNAYRLPSYHRLDFSINYYKDNKLGQAKWSLSVYNVYNRKNVYTANYGEEWVDIVGTTGNTRRYIDQKKLFGIMPSISYTLSF